MLTSVILTIGIYATAVEASARDHPTRVLLGYEFNCKSGSIMTAAQKGYAESDRDTQAAFASIAMQNKNAFLATSNNTMAVRDEALTTLSFMIGVHLNKVSPAAAAAAVHTGSSASLSLRYLEHFGIDVIEHPSKRVASHSIAKLASSLPCITFAHPDRVRPAKEWLQPVETSESSLTRDGHGASVKPAASNLSKVATNDNFYFLQWSHRMSKVAEGWKKQLGGPVNVAVVDTGCSFHPDLAANLWIDPENPKCKNADQEHPVPRENCYGQDFAVAGGSALVQTLDHGTATAGMIAATANNTIGLSGVCWQCKVACLKVSAEDDEMPDSALASAYHWIYQRRASFPISSHSYGSDEERSEALKRATNALLAVKDHLFVAAVGNNNCNLDVDPKSSAWTCKQPTKKGIITLKRAPIPAALPNENILAVGAIDVSGKRATFSNYGSTTVDLFAPGADIWAIRNGIPTGDATRLYSKTSGTSFSAPFTAGLAAVIKSAYPDYSATDIKKALMDTVLPNADLAGKAVAPGYVNLYAALGTLPDKAVTLPVRKPPTMDRRGAFYKSTASTSNMGLTKLGVLLTVMATFVTTACL